MPNVFIFTAEESSYWFSQRRYRVYLYQWWCLDFMTLCTTSKYRKLNTDSTRYKWDIIEKSWLILFITYSNIKIIVKKNNRKITIKKSSFWLGGKLVIIIMVKKSIIIYSLGQYFSIGIFYQNCIYMNHQPCSAIISK